MRHHITNLYSGKHPGVALALVDRLGLYHAIFTDPTSKEPKPDISAWKAAYGFLDAGNLQAEFAVSIYSRLVRNEEDAYIAWTFAAMIPWDGVKNPNLTRETQRLQNMPLIARAAREGIKATNKVCTAISAAHAYRNEVIELKRLACSEDEARGRRDVFGMAICRWDNKTGNWRLPVLYAILAEAMKKLETWPVSQDSERCHLPSDQGFTDYPR